MAFLEKFLALLVTVLLEVKLVSESLMWPKEKKPWYLRFFCLSRYPGVDEPRADYDAARTCSPL